jgi:hypothetical protein
MGKAWHFIKTEKQKQKNLQATEKPKQKENNRVASRKALPW